MMVGLGVLQLNTFLDGLIASYPSLVGSTIFGVEYPLAEGAMASVTYAQRLYPFPLGVFWVAIATAIFPALSRLAGDREAFGDLLRRGVRLVIFIGVPASVGLALVGPLLVRAILEGGRFSAGDADRVAFVLYGYAAGVWAYSMIHVFTRAFYAMGDARTPVRVAVAIVALNLFLNCTLIWTPLREAALAWSTSVCAIIQAIVLPALIRRRVPRILRAEVWSSVGVTLLLTAVMAATVAVVVRFMPAADSWWQTVTNLLAGVGAGVLVFGAGAWALRMPELRWALGRR